MIPSKAEVLATIAALRAQGKKIVFTNGCFDILHVGHASYLTRARALGDYLVVGLNTDQSVKTIKGESRPINAESDRAQLLLALKAVDGVILFGDRTAGPLIEEIRPDVYVKGADYTIDQIPEAKIVLGYGGKVELLEFVPGRSTTKLVDKIKGENGNT